MNFPDSVPGDTDEQTLIMQLFNMELGEHYKNAARVSDEQHMKSEGDSVKDLASNALLCDCSEVAADVSGAGGGGLTGFAPDPQFLGDMLSALPEHPAGKAAPAATDALVTRSDIARMMSTLKL